MSQVVNPTINGRLFQHSSIQFHFGMRIFEGVTSLTFTQTLQPGVARGTSPRKRGRTKGVHDASGSFEMLVDDYMELINALGNHYMDQEFRILANYKERGSPLHTAELIDVRITSEEFSSSDGEEPLVVSCDIDIMRIRLNGLEAV